jgi:hypothetical protein
MPPAPAWGARRKVMLCPRIRETDALVKKKTFETIASAKADSKRISQRVDKKDNPLHFSGDVKDWPGEVRKSSPKQKAIIQRRKASPKTHTTSSSSLSPPP